MSLIAYAGYDGPRRAVRLPQPKPQPTLGRPRIVAKPTRLTAGDELNRLGMKAFAYRGMPAICRNILLEVAIKHRVDVMMLALTSRKQIAVLARNEAMYLMKAQYPKASMPRMGAWFARDHTSILHAIASHQERAGLPHLVGYDLKRVRERNAIITARRRSPANTMNGAAE